MTTPTISEVEAKIKEVERRIKNIESDPDFDPDLKSLLAAGYYQMIAKGKQWLKENQ